MQLVLRAVRRTIPSLSSARLVHVARLGSVVSLTAVALLVAACAGGEAPGWTYAPASPSPSPTAVASPGASPAASPGGSPAESPVASGSPAASPGGSPGGTTITLTARGIEWVERELTAPANTPFTLVLDNQDAGVPHNVRIDDQSGAQVFLSGNPFPGVAQQTYQVPALAAGTYSYVCVVHPNMTGTLTVQ
ncbi:MAG TPA: cupredoxin domain-containing protein [Candidatus Limnocylindrales bacterium]|nr:cupredoxin domain-containing protein [Candidatus Limnocylindrales bacterium]